MIRRVKYCECGCRQEIIYKPYHEHYNVRFISGHNARGKPAWSKGKNKKEESKRRKKPFVEKYCECGCNTLLFSANRGQRFIKGHNIRGEPSWNKGKTKETSLGVRKISESRKKGSSWNKDKTKEDYPQLVRSKKCRKNISKARKGQKLSEKVKEIRKETMVKRDQKGKNNPMYGKPCFWKGKKRDPEVGKKISITRKKNGLGKGENNPNWQGGIGHFPYSFKFNNELKEIIRYRDNYQCQLCGVPEVENGRKLDIHHIDYNKLNCEPNNLIGLCRRCNPKVNYCRSQWQEYFTDKIEEIMNSKITKLKRIKPKPFVEELKNVGTK